jgi:hypothetical protein
MGRPCRNGRPVASQAIRQIAGQKSGPRGGEVVKDRRHSLDFAETNLNPTTAGEPRSPEMHAREARLRAALGPSVAMIATPPPGAVIAAPAQRLRRDATTWDFRPRKCCAGTARKGCLFSRTAATVTHSPRRARRICTNDLATARLEQKDPPRVDAARWILSCFY